MSDAITQVYCVDSDALITSHRYYRDTIFKGFWARMDVLISEGRLITVEDVVAECQHPPEVVAWLGERKDRIVRPYTIEIVDCLGRIVSELPRFVNPEQTDPGSADQMLVALAMAHNSDLFKGAGGSATVVTQEQAKGPGAKHLNIPNACAYYGITCVNMCAMMEIEGWVF